MQLLHINHKYANKTYSVFAHQPISQASTNFAAKSFARPNGIVLGKVLHKLAAHIQSFRTRPVSFKNRETGDQKQYTDMLIRLWVLGSSNVWGHNRIPCREFRISLCKVRSNVMNIARVVMPWDILAPVVYATY